MLNFLYKIAIREFVITQKGTKPLILKKKYFEGCIPYLDISVLENGIEKEYTFKELGNLATENDILVVWDGHRSGLVFKGKVGAIGSTLVGLTPVGLEQDYLYYFLKSQYDYIRGNTTGTGIPHVNPDVFFDIEIPYLPIKQQKEIIKELKDKLNENATLLEKQKELIRETLSVTNIPIMEDEDMAKMIQTFRQAVLQRAVSGELTEEWRRENKINYPATQFALGIFIENIQSGKSFRCVERTPNVDEIGVLKLSAISWSNYLENESKTCIDKTKVNPALFIRTGDFLMSRANTKELVGACVIVNSTQKKIMLSDKILRITFNKQLLPYYVLIFLRSAEGREQIERYAKGAQESMKNITQIDIRNIRLNIPNVDEQCEIVRQVELLFAIADKAQKQYETAMEYFQKLEKSVLLQAFSGELVEARAQTESLEDLLERIKVEREKLEKEKKVLRKEQAIFKQNIKNMEKKSIEEMLKEAPLSVEEIWQASVYFENKEVEKFYEELCKLSDDEKIDKYFLDDKKITTIVTLKEYAN